MLDEASPLVYLLIVFVAILLLGCVLAMFYPELAGLARSLGGS